jgi:hypothetical protein
MVEVNGSGKHYSLLQYETIMAIKSLIVQALGALTKKRLHGGNS